MYAEPIPPYCVAPIRFAPYGEYAEAFRFTAAMRLDGRSGTAGGPEIIDDAAADADVGPAGDVELLDDKALEFALDIATYGVSQRILDLDQRLLLENKWKGLAQAAPPLSHGFGGDTEAIL